MSTGQQPGGQQNTTTWTEPPWSGWIETTGDALLILEAARRGLIPRVTRRLVDSERKMITSGSVFVFDEDESGIKRWTDGFFWSPSRILGNFLLYRETDKRGSSHRGAKDNEPPEYDPSKTDSHSLSRPKSDPGHPSVDKQRERTLVGSLTNSYKFKPDGLVKKTFSLTIGGVAQHLISYYKVEDVSSGRLRPPSSLPELASLEISQEYLDKTHFRNPPKVEVGADGITRYRGEADDIDNSASLLTGPLTGLPLLTDGRVTENKRTKRFEPYGTPPAPKRPRKNTKSLPAPDSQQQQQEALTTPIASPTTAQQQQQVQAQTPQTYSDPNPNANGSTPTTATSPGTPYPPFSVAPYYQVHGYMQPPPPHVPMYAHQAPYAAISPTQPIPPPAHPHAVTTQYTYAGYPPPPAPASQPPAPGPTATTPISPSDPSHVAATSTSTQAPAHIQPGYYHPPPHPHPAYYGPPPPPTHPPLPHPGVGMHPTLPPPPLPNSTSHPPPPQMYAPYPPPPHAGHPTAVWPHPHPHAYPGYGPPPPPPHLHQVQQYSYGVYAQPQHPQQYAQGQYEQKSEPLPPPQGNEAQRQGQGDSTEEKPGSGAEETEGEDVMETEREEGGD